MVLSLLSGFFKKFPAEAVGPYLDAFEINPRSGKIQIPTLAEEHGGSYQPAAVRSEPLSSSRIFDFIATTEKMLKAAESSLKNIQGNGMLSTGWFLKKEAGTPQVFRFTNSRGRTLKFELEKNKMRTELGSESKWAELNGVFSINLKTKAVDQSACHLRFRGPGVLRLKERIKVDPKTPLWEMALPLYRELDLKGIPRRTESSGIFGSSPYLKFSFDATETMNGIYASLQAEVSALSYETFRFEENLLLSFVQNTSSVLPLPAQGLELWELAQTLIREERGSTPAAREQATQAYALLIDPVYPRLLENIGKKGSAT